MPGCISEGDDKEEALANIREAIEVYLDSLQADGEPIPSPERVEVTELRRFLIIIEKADHNYGAYAPDLPGCIATGKTLEETKRSMAEAVDFHIRGMKEDGLPIPEPTSSCEYVQIGD